MNTRSDVEEQPRASGQHSWRAWRAPDHVAEHALWLLLWFLFLCNPWFQPWYLLWALALLAIQPWRARVRGSIVVFCCTAMLSYLAGVFVLPALGWSGDGAEWNALASAAIYGPPLLVLFWPSTRSRACVPRMPPVVATRRPSPAPSEDI